MRKVWPTVFGIYVTIDGGEHWSAFKSGLPDVSVRDISIQKRESDLVLATFGRGFYVMDDYSALRELCKDKSTLQKDVYLFPVKDALMYVPAWRSSSLGSAYYTAPNPEFGATIQFFVKEVPKTFREIRHEKEKELFKNGDKIPQPTAEETLAEERETAPYIVLTISDELGNPVRKYSKSVSEGIQKLVWDLTYSSFDPINEKDKFDPVAKSTGSTLAMPGKYKASLVLVNREGAKEIGTPVEFNCVALRNTTLPAIDRKELVEFQKKASSLARIISGTYQFLQAQIKHIETLKQAAVHSPLVAGSVISFADSLDKRLDDLYLKFQRRSTRPSAEENPPSPVTFNERLDALVYTHWTVTSGITKNEVVAYDVLADEFPPVYYEIKRIAGVDIPAIENQLEIAKAVPVPGRLPELKIGK